GAEGHRRLRACIERSHPANLADRRHRACRRRQDDAGPTVGRRRVARAQDRRTPMTGKIEPAVGAAGEGGTSRVADNPLHIASMQPKVQPLSLAEFLTIAREVTQEGGHRKRSIGRFNAFVDAYITLRGRRVRPKPKSSPELQGLLRWAIGGKSYRRRIHEIWLDYEGARRAQEFRGEGGAHGH